MKKKDYLRQMLYIQKQVASLIVTLNNWKSICSIVREKLEEHNDVFKDGLSELESCMQEINALEMEIQESVRDWFERMKIINAAINELDDPAEQAVMRYRYINALDWKEICTDLAISESTAYRIHRSALDHIKIQGCN